MYLTKLKNCSNILASLLKGLFLFVVRGSHNNAIQRHLSTGVLGGSFWEGVWITGEAEF